MTISSENRKAGPFDGNGVTTSFPFTFKTFTKSDVKVIYTNVSEVEAILTLDSDYTVTLNPDQNANPGGSVSYSTLASGEKLTIIGNVEYTQETDIQNQGGFYPEIIEDALDKLTMQIQQVKEIADRSVAVPVSSGITPENYLSTLDGLKTDATNAANSASYSASLAVTSASNASTSESNALNSENAASASEVNASNSANSASASASTATAQSGIATTQAGIATTQAGIATTQAGIATTKAGEALTSANNALNSENAAASSALSAAAIFDDFNDRYLGAKAVAPTLDNDGNALKIGALYFNTVDNAMKVWNGSAWLDAYTSLSGALIATNNLSDLANASTARSNLGLASLATQGDGIKGNIQVADGGTNWWIRSSAVTNTMLATTAKAIGKQTIWIPAGAMSPRTTNGAQYVTTQLGTNGTLITALAFDTATAEYAQFQIRMPKSWNESTVTFTPVWSQAIAGTNSVAWVLHAKAIGDTESIDTSWGTDVTVIDAANNSAYPLNISAESSAVTIANASELEWVVFEIYRDVANGSDTMAQDALLLGITINYTTDAANDA